jgi:hypothetical protein
MIRPAVVAVGCAYATTALAGSFQAVAAAAAGLIEERSCRCWPHRGPWEEKRGNAEVHGRPTATSERPEWEKLLPLVRMGCAESLTRS